jgi:hypothetical protein
MNADEVMYGGTNRKTPGLKKRMEVCISTLVIAN